MTISRYALSILFAAAFAVAQPRNPDAALGAARHLEEVEGNYPAAIEAYKKFLAQYGKDRVRAAKALVRLGECYEKLGDAESRKAYERVVSEFADQKDAAETARLRLEKLGRGAATATAASSRLIYNEPSRATSTDAPGQVGGFTPDGRYLIQSAADGGLGLRELATGKFRQLTKTSAFDIQFSADGTQVVFDHATQDGTEVRIIGADGTGERGIWQEPRSGGWFVWPMGWLPDRKHIILHFFQSGKPSGSPGKIMSVPVADGAAATLWEGPTYNESLALSPDAKYVVYEKPVQKSPPQQDLWLLSLENKTEGPILQHPATADPVDWTPDGKGILFLSDRREPGKARDLWLLRIADGRPQGAPTLIKDAGDAWTMGITRNGAIYSRQVSGTREILTAELDPGIGKGTGNPSLVVSKAVAPNISRDGRWLSYCMMAPRTGAVTFGLQSLDTGQVRSVPTKLAGDCSTAWFPDGRSLLVKARFGLHRLNAEDGTSTLLKAGQFVDQVQVSPDGKTIYYMLAKPGDPQTQVLALDLETGKEREIVKAEGYGPTRSLGLALSPDGNRLAISRADRGSFVIEIVSLASGERRELERVRQPEWIHAGVWSPDGRYLVSGHAATQGGPVELRRIPVDGGPAQNMGITAAGIGGIAIHPDGRRIYYVAEQTRGEIWALENFLPGLRTPAK